MGKKEECVKIISPCKRAISIFQNLNNIDSIKSYEKLFILFLGHSNREIRNNVVQLLNIIYEQTTWQEKNSFPLLENTKIKLFSEELNLELSIDRETYSEKSIVLILSSFGIE